MLRLKSHESGCFESDTVLKNSWMPNYGITRGFYTIEGARAILDEIKPDAVLVHEFDGRNPGVSAKQVADETKNLDPNIPCLVQRVNGKPGPVTNEDGYKYVNVPYMPSGSLIHIRHGGPRPDAEQLARMGELVWMVPPEGKYYEIEHQRSLAPNSFGELGGGTIEIVQDPDGLPINLQVEEYLASKLAKGRAIG